MPRHPPNAQKNKQQNKNHNNTQTHTTHTRPCTSTCLSQKTLTVRCSRPLYSSQPTHPHPQDPPATHQQTPRVGQPGRTAPEPRQHATPTHTHPSHRETSTRGSTPPQGPDHHTADPRTRRVSYTNKQPHPPHPKGRGRATATTYLPMRHPTQATPQQNQGIRRTQARCHTTSILRKEVIQPHLPVRLPCYDFVPITSPTFDRSP